MTACDLFGEIDSLMARLVSCVISFWCDWPVMISDLAACSKELSAGTFNYRGDWFWLQSPPRLVFISNCRLTVKQHYQRCHPKPKLLMYKSSPGPDYHSVSGMWATVALFLLTTPSFPPSLLLLLFSLSFKYLSAHIKTDVKCTRYMLYLRQIRARCVRMREFILERYCKHLHVLRVLII